MMKYKFEAQVGARPTRDGGRHRNDQLFLFFPVGGSDLSLYQAVNEGLVEKLEPSMESISGRIYPHPVNRFATSLPLAKIFVSCSVFGSPKVWTNVFVRFSDGEEEEVSIVEVSTMNPALPFQIVVKGVPLKRKKVQDMRIYPIGTPGRRFLDQQPTLPAKTYAEFISIQPIRTPGRVVRVKR